MMTLNYWKVINKYREEKGYTWYRLAKETGIHEATINTARYKNRQLNFKYTCQIANTLELDINHLNEWKNNS